jgi:hypothetical protein
MNRDHIDHIEDVKHEPSFAGFRMGAPNNEGIVLVAPVDIAPTTFQICESRA